MRAATELASRIGRSLLSASSGSSPMRTWSSSLEQILHRLGCRSSLTPSLVASVIDPFLLKHHSLALGFFSWAAQQPGFFHDSVSYRSILKTLSFSPQFNEIENLLKQAETQRIELDSLAYQYAIDCMVMGTKNRSAYRVFCEAVSLGREIGPKVCNSLIASLASDGSFIFAQNVLDEMIKRGSLLNTIGFGVLIWKLCETLELSQVLNMVEKVKKINADINGSIIAVLIVHGLCKVSREHDAFWVLDHLREMDCKPDFIAYRIVAEAFRATGSLHEREMVLKKKRKLGVAPRSGDYRVFILDLISLRRLTEAKDLTEVIISGDFPIDEDVLNAVIGTVSSNDPNSAFKFLKYMIDKGKILNPLTLTNMSKNLCKHGKGDKLMEVYDILSSSNYFSDLGSYEVMVSFMCKAGRVREAYEVIQEMKKNNGLSPDVSLYNTLMEACCREGFLRPAKRLWDEMFTNGCNANLSTYSILIKKLSEEGEADEALRLFHHMMGRSIEPDATVYKALLEGLCRERKLASAFEVFDICVQQNAELSSSLLNNFVLHLCKSGHCFHATNLLRGLTSDIISSDSHAILLTYLADAKEAQRGIEYIKWVKETSPLLVDAICSKILTFHSSSRSDLIFFFLQALNGNANEAQPQSS